MDAVKGGDKESLVVRKLPLDLVTPGFVDGIAQVLRFGAYEKPRSDGTLGYGPHNWMKGLPYAEVIAAIERHTLAIKRGEDRDPETGILHTYHLACETMFLAYMQENWVTYAMFDNREFKETF